jgi:putative glutamine amidotransferase
MSYYQYFALLSKANRAAIGIIGEQGEGKINLKPRIAIPVPTSTDLAYNQRSWHQYAEAVADSGGDPVEVPLTLSATELRELIESCHGIVLPGSPADVDPARYGADRDPATAPADPARENVDYALLDHASKTGKPILAICFGCQSMNVWRGGTLVQDLTPLPVNHSAGAQVAVAHTALVATSSSLAALTDAAEAPRDGDYLRLPINTSHHQAVGAPGDGLRVAARCPDDGVIEAIELDPKMFHVEHFEDPTPAKLFHVEHSAEPLFLGVQWHPERSFHISPTSRNLFHRLVTDAALR